MSLAAACGGSDPASPGGSGGSGGSGGFAGEPSNGGSGGDSSTGGSGGDSSTGGTGGDSSTGGTGGDSSTGGTGGDSSTGGTGGDSSTGGTGGDSSTGGSGGDSSTGGTGGDSSTGGTGGDAGGPSEGGSGGSDEGCEPRTCEDASAVCGDVDDGCGGILRCGECGDGTVCVDGACLCVPASCDELGTACGPAADGCGGTLDCGGCGDGLSCIDGACTCAPRTCADVRASCGEIDDGCGGTLLCGVCEDGLSCIDGACVCAPRTCADAGAACGPIDDGCGGSLDCGGCGSGSTCANNQCICVPLGCDEVGAACGLVDNGCGGALDCGTCGDGSTCRDNQCVCSPLTCADLGAACGAVADGCGGTLDCGGCGNGGSCVDNQCACVPETDLALCRNAGAECGPIVVTDSCGGVRVIADCGTCIGAEVCGLEQANVCGSATPAWRWEQPFTGENLKAVWGFAADDTWAVGSNGAIVHWDGTATRIVPSGTTANLHDVWGSAPDDVWAAGDAGTLLHFDGASWSPVESHLTTPIVSISGHAANDVWAIASDATGSLSLHFNGTDWRIVPVSVLGAGQTLRRVRAIAPDGVWAVGSKGTVLRWNGTMWERNDPGSATADFQDVWGETGSHVFVIGGIPNGSTTTPVVRRWVLTAWMPISYTTGLSTLNDAPLRIWGEATTGNPWLVSRAASGNRLYRWLPNTTAWFEETTKLAMPRPLAVGGTPNGDLWVSGEGGQLKRQDGSTFAPLTEPALSCSVVFALGQDAWAGCGPNVYARETTGWTALPALPPVTNATITAIWASSPTNVWVASTVYDSRIFRWDGAAWTLERAEAYKVLALTGDENGMWLGGDTNLLRRLEGATNTKIPNVPSSVVRGLYSAWAGHAVAVGTSGKIGVYDGATWTWTTPVTSSTLFTAVHGSSPDDVWAIANGGDAVHWNGGSWTRSRIGTKDLVSITVVSPTEAWALDTDGLLYGWNGTDWSSSRVLQPFSARSISAMGPGDLLTVGTGIQHFR
ncbi:hypothetical protein [Vulgatibacter incomptus]|nr:hypothetical protein [Vulgatibacter incomptus]